MSDRSAIEWTDATWNPIRARNRATGKVGWFCIHASEGCRFCYAERQNVKAGASGGNGAAYAAQSRDQVEIFLDERTLLAPLSWRKPRKIFPCSMTDLFGEWVTDEMLDRIFAVMGLTRHHTYQSVTKRASRMRAYACDPETRNRVELAAEQISPSKGQPVSPHWCFAWPLPNVWLLVSCEDQRTAEERIPELLRTPAVVRGISAEPLLGPIDLTAPHIALGAGRNGFTDLDWVIAGGESGAEARPMQALWARDLRDQCEAADVAFFFKQWGEFLPVGQHLPGFGKINGATAVRPGRMRLHYSRAPTREQKYAFADKGVPFASTSDNRLTFRVGKRRAGRLLDGRTHDEFPQTAEEGR